MARPLAADSPPPGRRQILLAALPGLLVWLGASGCRQATPFACTDVRGLTAEAIRARDDVGYVDRAPDPERTCDRCNQWAAPAGEGCGGCRLFQGPVHPNGYCRVFARRG